jgi:hypothetical protein
MEAVRLVADEQKFLNFMLQFIRHMGFSKNVMSLFFHVIMFLVRHLQF